MKITRSIFFAFLAAIALLCDCGARGQSITHTSVPLGDVLDKALNRSLLTSFDARPFHLLMKISEPENPQSPYQGTLEEWWLSPSLWRREVTTGDGMHQTIVVSGGKQTEKDEGDYYPLWLRRFVVAVFDVVPDADAWKKSGITLDQITLPNGDKSSPTARIQGKVGSGDQATSVFYNVSFDAKGRISFFGSPRYSMEFKDYRGFGDKQIARRLIDHPESGTELVGEIRQLEGGEAWKDSTVLFTPLEFSDNRFESVQLNTEMLEHLSGDNAPIAWSTVHSGNTRGHLAVYISADAKGNVREAWPLDSDNAGLDDSVREQVRQWKLKPVTDEKGDAVQVDGSLGFLFDTKIANPLPELSDAETRVLATHIVEPKLDVSGLHKGDTFTVVVSVDEQGKVAGLSFPHMSGTVATLIYAAIREWTFKPLIRNGKPQYFHGNVQLTVR